jgi:hypothetical protein
MSLTDDLFSIVGIEERETKRKVWNYGNSIFCNILIPVFYCINLLYLYNANIFNDFNISASIPLYLDIIIKIILRSVLTIGSILYSKIVIVFVVIIFLCGLILFLGNKGFFKTIRWEEEIISADGFVYTSNYFSAKNRLCRFLWFILTDFWIVYCFSKNLLNNTFDIAQLPKCTTCFLWVISSANIMYIFITQLFVICSFEDNNKLKPNDILNSDNSRYIVLNHITYKNKDRNCEECHYIIKDTYLKVNKFIYMYFTKKYNDYYDRTECIKNSIFTTDQFEEVKYIFDNATKNQ